MSTDHDSRSEEILPSYVLGVLEAEDTLAVEQHLAGGCKICEVEILAFSRLLENMVDSIEPVVPSEMARARTLGAIESPEAKTPSQTPLRRRDLSPSWRVAIAAGLALLVWSGWSQFDLRRQVERLAADREGLTRELELVRTDLGETRTELARTLLASRIVSAPRARSILLAGLESAPESSARTFIDPGTSRAVFYASNLEPLEADKTYQLWFIADGKPVPAGTFAVDIEGSGSVLVEDVSTLESLQAWAVTVEPAGGVPQPTGDMVLLGSMV